MSDDLIWPSMARVIPGRIHESTIRDFEADSMRRQWETQKKRLFCDDEDDMLVECGTISEKGINVCEFENYADLETFLESQEHPAETAVFEDEAVQVDQAHPEVEEPNESQKRSTFFFINPDYGWDTLSITSLSMQKLLHHLGAFVQFFKYLQAFGMKTFAMDEGYAGFDFCIEKDKSQAGDDLKGIETAYLLKYVDKKEAPKEFSNPWSIRQALIYQKSNVKTEQDTYIFIRLSELLGGRFRDLLSKRRAEERGLRILHWTEVHVMAFRSVIENWREYINWLDGDVSQLFDHLILAAVEPTKLGTLDSVSNSLNLMKRLQYMLDQSLRTSRMLDLNIEVMKRMQTAATKAKYSDATEARRKYEGLIEGLESAMNEHIFLRKNVSSLVERASILSTQLRDTILFRNSELNKDISNASFRGTAAMVDLSHKSSHEARVVKALTVIALVFVPTSFVADFLQMGYLQTSMGGPFSVSATNGLVLYVILALPLVLFIFVVYALLEVRNRRIAARERAWGAGTSDEEAGGGPSRSTTWEKHASSKAGK